MNRWPETKSTKLPSGSTYLSDQRIDDTAIFMYESGRITGQKTTPYVEQDIAVQALRSERVTTNKAWWKEIQKAKKYPQTFVYTLPKDKKLTPDQRKLLKTLVSAVVHNNFDPQIPLKSLTTSR